MNVKDNKTEARYKFQKIWSIPIGKFSKNIHSINYNLKEFIPKEWQLILMSDGSFTQNLISLTGKIISLSIISQSIYYPLNSKSCIREIWLVDSLCRKLAFAQSIWPKYNKNENNIFKPNNQTIGQLLIESKVDIHKDIHEIYYGYCTYLEKHLSINEPTWGRKYTIYYNNRPLTTIQEIFSPSIINFFIVSS